MNYLAIKNLIDAAKESKTCKRIVRVTGKGEEPTAFFTVLINKAWNYEGEQLLRMCSDIDYTIIRPGIMGNDDIPRGKVLALACNGQDLPVSAVTHSQIANLCAECLDHPNTQRSTLTAMNVEPGKGEDSYGPLLTKVAPDTKIFPTSLIHEHQRAARIGSAILVSFIAIFLSAAIISFKYLSVFVLGILSQQS